jgi:hypothetical protein
VKVASSFGAALSGAAASVIQNWKKTLVPTGSAVG